MNVNQNIGVTYNMTTEYYHPNQDKIISIEKGFNGGVATVIESSKHNDRVQSLTIEESEVDRFVQGLQNDGWLRRQQL
jgi:hypothetical protein